MDELVYIVIVNYNGYEDTLECVDSIDKITYSNYRIIIVDNGSTNNSYQILKDKCSSDIILISSDQNLGFAGGNNIGIRRALELGAEYVLLLNNDTVVEKDFLEPLVERAKKSTNIAAVGGKINYFSEKDTIWYAGAKLNSFTALTKHIGVGKKDVGKKYNISCQTKYVVGCLMLVPRKIFEAIGFMEEDYFLYYEELDWNIRMIKAGYELWYEPKSIIYHKVSAETKKLNDIVGYYYERNSYFFVMRNFGYANKAFMFIFKRIRLFLKLIKYTVKRNRTKRVITIKVLNDIRKGIMGEMKK